VPAWCVEQAASITADAAGLAFIDAARLRPLADAQALCHQRGRDVRVASARVAVRRVVTLTGPGDRLFGE
jgi:anti-anti-sigma regulatory factor